MINIFLCAFFYKSKCDGLEVERNENVNQRCWPAHRLTWPWTTCWRSCSFIGRRFAPSASVTRPACRRPSRTDLSTPSSRSYFTFTQGRFKGHTAWSSLGLGCAGAVPAHHSGSLLCFGVGFIWSVRFYKYAVLLVGRIDVHWS